MKQPWILPCAVALCLCAPSRSFAAPATPEPKPVAPAAESAPRATPVNANATPQARKLLAFLYEVQGRYTLAAQHNYASAGAKQTNLVRAITGKTPIMWGSDFSFCYQGSEPQEFQHCGPLNLTHPFEPLFYLKATPEEVRQRLVETALKLHKDGHIITLMWHAPPPGADNCVDGKKIWTWDKRPTQQEWDELLTEGSPMNTAWKKQADEIAGYLGQLRDAKVPVLWRPYHEMNGIWFWWCNKPGETGFKRLWIMMYDYFVKRHKLDNLIWVWDANAPRTKKGDEAGAYQDYWPGTQYVDVLAADVYGKDWRKSHHDELVTLGGGKPIALGEVGESPSPQLLDEQPRWTWFMPWFLETRRPEILRAIYADKRVLSKDDVTVDAEGNYKLGAGK